MYEELKLLGAFTIGLGAGILASKRFFQTKYEKIAEEEIKSVREAISHRSGHILEVDSLKHPEEIAEKVKAELSKKKPVIYSSIDRADFYEDRANEMKKYIEDIKAESEHPEDDRSDDVYQITEEEFSETELGYDKIICRYYTDDDMLVNEDTDETELSLINAMNEEDLKELRYSNAEELYFRYDQYGSDYDIIRIEGKYYIDM